ncbi:MAG: (4Fe-4S)-binding protein, partial [Candidatus Heimdallarchaeota archaeon]|nr:(4Fe-4S)-binding protein [Candidatus Heimdallarchaeota archaeon]
MSKMILSKDKLGAFLEGLTKYKLFGPTEDNGVVAYKNVSPKEISLDFQNSTMPPKNILFQQTETMFKFKSGKNSSVSEIAGDDGRIIVFGIRPCDAKSFALLDPVFKNDFSDPYYVNRREKATLVGLTCNIPPD